jgi:hypothetical protein
MAQPTLGLVNKWGADKVSQICAKALEAEAINVNLIARMIVSAPQKLKRNTSRPRRKSLKDGSGETPANLRPRRLDSERPNAAGAERTARHSRAAETRTDE